MSDFKNLTLSDFYGMDLFSRKDGTISPIIDYKENGEPIGLAGFNGEEIDSDIEIKEAAFLFYQQLIENLNSHEK